jgi:hypothetical protein
MIRPARAAARADRSEHPGVDTVPSIPGITAAVGTDVPRPRRCPGLADGRGNAPAVSTMVRGRGVLTTVQGWTRRRARTAHKRGR